MTKYTLAPLLMWQGARVRKTALRLPEADGPRTGTLGEGTPLRVLLVGDSSAAGVGVSQQDVALSGHLFKRLAKHHRVTWQIIARSGDTTATLTRRVTETAPGQFDLAISCLGVNDVTEQVPRRKWLRQQATLYEVLRTRFGVSHILASGLPPIGLFPALPQPLRWFLGCQAHRFDRALADHARQFDDVTYYPLVFPRGDDLMAEDGYHPTAKIYGIWAGLIEDALAGRA